MNITSNADEVVKALRNIQRQIPFIASRTLNETGKAMVVAENRKIGQVFDNPVPATQKAVALSKRATKGDLTANVIVKDNIGKGNSPVQWLYAEVMGGVRRRKRSEKALTSAIGHRGIAIPAFDYKRNRYGNVTGASYSKAIKSLRAKDGKFFRGRGKQRNIIYEKTKAADNKKARPFLILANRAKYHKRFHFFKIGEQEFKRNNSIIFNREFTKALKTSGWSSKGSPVVSRGKFGDFKKK